MDKEVLDRFEKIEKQLPVKKKDFWEKLQVANLFSPQKQNRVIAANEISSNWSTDELMLTQLLARAGNCLTNKDSAPDCDNGIYNTMVVLSNFSKALLVAHKQEIKTLVNKIPGSSTSTLNQSEELLKKID